VGILWIVATSSIDGLGVVAEMLVLPGVAESIRIGWAVVAAGRIMTQPIRGRARQLFLKLMEPIRK